MKVLAVRQEMTTADRLLAQSYQEGDVLRYAKKSEAYGIKAGEYAEVTGVDSNYNMLNVQWRDGTELSYDPSRLLGVTVYEEAERSIRSA